MVLSIHGNSQIPILSGFDCLYFTTVILVLIKIQWELEVIFDSVDYVVVIILDRDKEDNGRLRYGAICVP